MRDIRKSYLPSYTFTDVSVLEDVIVILLNLQTCLADTRGVHEREREGVVHRHLELDGEQSMVLLKCLSQANVALLSCAFKLFLSAVGHYLVLVSQTLFANLSYFI